MKDTEADELDAGWDDAEPVASSAPRVSVAEAEDLEGLDAGWDDGPELAAPRTDTDGASPHAGRARTDRMSKRERRAFERKKRLQAEQRRTERRTQEKRERRDQARLAQEKREAERREALARAERSQSNEKARPSAESDARPPKAARPRRRFAEPVTKPGSGPHPRFRMPNGGWIIVVIALITLATAWYAFGR